MRKEKKQYAVLGLGVFGSTVAKTLSSYDMDVIAIDSDIKCVNRIADNVNEALQCDVTELEQLSQTGVGDCDIAIVGMGSHLEESVMAIINLKELGVPYIIVKAKNKRYGEIFSKVGADRIIQPEKEMGKQLAKSLLGNKIVEMFDLDSEFSIVEVEVPYRWIGSTLRNLDVRKKYGINVIGIRKGNHLTVSPGADYVLAVDDHLVVIADLKTLSKIDFLNNV